MNRLVLCLLVAPLTAFGADIPEVVRSVAESKVAINTTIHGMQAEVVYVGQFDSCDSVSIVWPRDRIENFRICNNEIHARNNVSPSWDGEGQAAIFRSVINNATIHGQAKQKDTNGYIISARTMNALNDDCKILETIISYDGDLVDRDLRKICQK